MQQNDRSGFTLIELLIVVVIIGILASIAIPKFSAMRQKSYIAAVTSDLKNMASQQEVYLSDHDQYASDFTQLEMTATAAVTVTINQNDRGVGWAATGTHTGLAGAQCGIFYGTGSASNASPATLPGTVSCN